jgi:NAD(P)-dependent dehydrogenase (short-subunit alcohol dehydrogenase family)
MSGGLRRFEGRVVVISGAASGIGAASAQRFAQEGARVALLDLNAEGAAHQAEAIGDETLALACDHSDPAQCERAVQAVVARWGVIDVLFNNAAGSAKTTLEDCPDALLQSMLGSALVGPWNLTRAALPALKAAAAQREAGATVLFTGSRLSGTGAPANAPYIVAKHGIVGLVRSLAVDAGPFNIRVNAVCPGLVPTPRVQVATVWGTPEEVQARYLARTPLRRVTQPDDIASAAAWLASDEARAISGQALYIDGGMSAQ